MLDKALPCAVRPVGLFLLFALSCQMLAGEAEAQSAPPSSHRMPVARTFSYTCDGGVTVKVTLREQNARVVFRDKSYSMKQVRSASGVRYSDGQMVWWNQGYDGFLEDETDSAHTVRLADNCKQTSPQPKSP